MTAGGERPVDSTFGTLLRQCRLDAGMTQQTLAERARLSVEAVSTLERGARTRPYRETVALLARALELSPKREALLERAANVAQPLRPRVGIDLKPSLLRVAAHAGRIRRHNLPQQLTSVERLLSGRSWLIDLALGAPEPYWLNPRTRPRACGASRSDRSQRLTPLMSSGATMTQQEAIALAQAVKWAPNAVLLSPGLLYGTSGG